MNKKTTIGITFVSAAILMWSTIVQVPSHIQSECPPGSGCIIRSESLLYNIFSTHLIPSGAIGAMRIDFDLNQTFTEIDQDIITKYYVEFDEGDHAIQSYALKDSLDAADFKFENDLNYDDNNSQSNWRLYNKHYITNQITHDIRSDLLAQITLQKQPSSTDNSEFYLSLNGSYYHVLVDFCYRDYFAMNLSCF